ncbi:MAG: FAD-binding protein [Sphingomonadales bacterium]|nr:FAD-binding protein [Sphingomonadales bacterium]
MRRATPPETWDIEVDFVAVGSGIGGISGAIAAQALGLEALVIERDALLGGVTALSMGEVWVAGNHLAAAMGIDDSAESGFRYIQRLAMDYADEDAILNLTTHAAPVLKWFEDNAGLRMMVIGDCPDYYAGASNDAVMAGRMLECEPFPARLLGDWQERVRCSPNVPYGLTHADIGEAGGSANMLRWPYDRMGARLEADERCLGPGLIGWLIRDAIRRGIPMRTGTSAEELYTDGERVVGLRAVHEGRDISIRARRGVLLAVSSYERDAGHNKRLSHQLDLQSMVLPTVDGAALRLAGPLGARTAKVPDITALGMPMIGEEDVYGLPIWRNAMVPIGLPHAIVVNRSGRRFANESFYRDIFARVDQIDGATQTHPNFPCWAVIDSRHREKYPFGTYFPGSEFPAAFAERADTIAGLATKIGVDPAALEATVARFNAQAEAGVDPDFHRGEMPWNAWMCGDRFHGPNPNLGPLTQAPFHAVRLHRMGGSAIAANGLLADEHCRALGWDDEPIAGLYVGGNAQARTDTGAMMQSGISNARGMVHGWLAAHHAAGRPSDRLERARAAMAGTP